MNEFCWDEDDSTRFNSTYAIYIAAKNKAAGKEYIDPYKNISADTAIKDSTKKFGKKMRESISDFLPYDMPKSQHLRTIVKMKRLLEQAIKEHYVKQNS
jgi:hypothetical protein